RSPEPGPCRSARSSAAGGRCSGFGLRHQATRMLEQIPQGRQGQGLQRENLLAALQASLGGLKRKPEGAKGDGGLRFHRFSCCTSWNSIERLRSRKKQGSPAIEHVGGLS